MTSIVGLDLSLTATGYADKDGAAIIRTSVTGIERLSILKRKIVSACMDRADVVVIEGYSYNSANKAHQIGELGGVVRLALWTYSIPFVEVPPAVLKKYATGRGNASKSEVLTAAVRRLDYGGSDDNEADALWLWTMGAHRYGVKNPDLPIPQAAALARIDWPEL